MEVGASSQELGFRAAGRGVAGKKAPKLRTKVSGGLSSFVLLPANSLGHEHSDVTPALGAIFFRFTVIPISR